VPTPWRISSARELMPSFMNTLLRWYSTVRWLRNSCAAMSLFELPLADQARDLQLLRSQLGGGAGIATHGLAGCPQLDRGTLDPGSCADLLEARQRRAQMMAGLETFAFPPQQLSVEEVRARPVEEAASPLMQTQRVLVVGSRVAGLAAESRGLRFAPRVRPRATGQAPASRGGGRRAWFDSSRATSADEPVRAAREVSACGSCPARAGPAARRRPPTSRPAPPRCGARSGGRR
jgi:hypothetical protein